MNVDLIIALTILLAAVSGGYGVAAIAFFSWLSRVDRDDAANTGGDTRDA